jgi:hypothetical protein
MPRRFARPRHPLRVERVPEIVHSAKPSRLISVTRRATFSVVIFGELPILEPREQVLVERVAVGLDRPRASV